MNTRLAINAKLVILMGETGQLKRRSRWKQLTEEEVRQFVEQGYIALREVFSREIAERILPLVWAKLEIARDDASTWTGPMVILREVLKDPPVPQIHTRRYFGAIDDLCRLGRWHAHNGAGVWPIVLPGFAKPPWHPPPMGEWHVEGNWFHHRINSAEQGLVCLQLFTDIETGRRRHGRACRFPPPYSPHPRRS